MKSPLITVMSAAAIKAGKGLLRDFGEVDQLHVSRKGAAGFVTKSDTRSEKLLKAELSRARPDFGFLMEESGETKGRDAKHRWIVDPLDGTTNFIHAVPYFCVSVALERADAGKAPEIVAGVIYDPLHNELFFAEKGKGAYLEARKLFVSQREKLEDAMLVTGNLHNGEEGRAEMLTRIQRAGACGGCVRYGAATALDLAYLAAGRYDACWYAATKPWDVAAGMLIAREAGAMLSQLDGTAASHLSGSLLATNQALHKEVTKLLAG